MGMCVCACVGGGARVVVCMLEGVRLCMRVLWRRQAGSSYGGSPARPATAAPPVLSAWPDPVPAVLCAAVRSVGSNMATPLTYTAKLESVAASAVKAADKVGAALMVVVTHTGVGGRGWGWEVGVVGGWVGGEGWEWWEGGGGCIHAGAEGFGLWHLRGGRGGGECGGGRPCQPAWLPSCRACRRPAQPAASLPSHATLLCLPSRPRAPLRAGTTAAMVAKYRPHMPILTLVGCQGCVCVCVCLKGCPGHGGVRRQQEGPPCRSGPTYPSPCSPLPCPPSPPAQVVPYLKRDGLKWKLEGRHAARQALLTSGLMPMLAAPTPSGERPPAQASLHLRPRLRLPPGARSCAAVQLSLQPQLWGACRLSPRPAASLRQARFLPHAARRLPGGPPAACRSLRPAAALPTPDAAAPPPPPSSGGEPD